MRIDYMRKVFSWTHLTTSKDYWISQDCIPYSIQAYWFEILLSHLYYESQTYYHLLYRLENSRRFTLCRVRCLPQYSSFMMPSFRHLSFASLDEKATPSLKYIIGLYITHPRSHTIWLVHGSWILWSGEGHVYYSFPCTAQEPNGSWFQWLQLNLVIQYWVWFHTDIFFSHSIYSKRLRWKMPPPHAQM